MDDSNSLRGTFERAGPGYPVKSKDLTLHGREEVAPDNRKAV